VDEGWWMRKREERRMMDFRDGLASSCGALFRGHPFISFLACL
jgi:hypothetical protein